MRILEKRPVCHYHHEIIQGITWICTYIGTARHILNLLSPMAWINGIGWGSMRALGVVCWWRMLQVTENTNIMVTHTEIPLFFNSFTNLYLLYTCLAIVQKLNGNRAEIWICKWSKSRVGGIMILLNSVVNCVLNFWVSTKEPPDEIIILLKIFMLSGRACGSKFPTFRVEFVLQRLGLGWTPWRVWILHWFIFGPWNFGKLRKICQKISINSRNLWDIRKLLLWRISKISTLNFQLHQVLIKFSIFW